MINIKIFTYWRARGPGRALSVQKNEKITRTVNILHIFHSLFFSMMDIKIFTNQRGEGIFFFDLLIYYFINIVIKILYSSSVIVCYVIYFTKLILLCFDVFFPFS